jgi:transcriptional regulator with XRE-family HTH domain
MKIITPSQCRAARALLNDMKRSDLAELSGVSVGTIGGFETEKSEPRVTAVQQLRLALESAGAEFIDTDGVCARRDHVRTFEGRSAHRRLLDEIYQDTKEIGGEILIKGVDETRWASGDDEAFLSHHIDRLTKAGVTERLLISESHPIIVSHKHWYRRLPDQYFAPHTQWIFAGKVAMVTWGDVEKVIIIESRALFDAAVREFHCIWDNVGRPLD